MFTLLAVSVLALAQQPGSEWTDLPTGLWHAWFDSPGGRLECDMNLRREKGATIFEFVNDAEYVAVPKMTWDRARLALALDFPHYDSHISSVASADGLHLDGEWSKRSGADSWTKLAFHAEFFVSGGGGCSMPGPGGPDHGPFDGRWSAKFESSPDPAVAIFGVYGPDDSAKATFLTTLGDYRYLHGRYSKLDKSLTLSCFDGAHAFLFKALPQPDGSIAGDFWSGDKWHESWSAKKDEHAALPDPFGLTKAVEGAHIASLEFPDLTGKPRSLAEWSGHPRLVVLFGSWCPNCNDEAAFLRELDVHYAKFGLQVIGIAFEVSGDFARDAQQVKLFGERHKLRFPLLIGGMSDKESASKRVPLLDKIRAYPTTLFVRADGSIRAVHQGYSGPATGAEHTKLREDFERLIDELLAESDKKK